MCNACGFACCASQIEEGLRVDALILREVLGQLRPSVRDKVEGVALRLECVAAGSRVDADSKETGNG